MLGRADRTTTLAWALRACVALPWLMLAANVLSWLRWGTDLPFFDDWRAYAEGSALSLAPARLFEAINNTISPVGLSLDVLAQRWLGGNSIAYQTLSMLVVLGGLLWMQWRLLGWAVRDRRLQAMLFAFCFFMLQSGSYWGEQNLAYHQALPLLALMGVACVVFLTRLTGAGYWVILLVLGLLAGLSYISGAVAGLVMGAAWVLVAMLLGARGESSALTARVRVGGFALMATGLLTCALQFVITRRTAPGARVQFLGLTWPDSPDFWAFLAGALGRASGHGAASLGLEVAWALLLALASLAAAAVAVRRLASHTGPRGARLRRWAMVMLPLWGVVLVYLAMVSVGRAGFRDPSVQDAGAVLRLGAERFHFFWATLLFPWLAGGLALAGRRGATWRPRAVLAGVLVLACAVAWFRGVFDVPAFYRAASAYQANEIRCLTRQLGTGQPVVCPGYTMMGITDLSPAYAYAREINASFVRYLPLVERGRFGKDLLGGVSAASLPETQWRQSRALPDGWRQSDGDAQLIIDIPDRADAARCRVLGVQLGVRAHEPSAAQVFYRAEGQTNYTEDASVRKAYTPGQDGNALVEFVIETRDHGFEPALRIDPHRGHEPFQLTDLRVACLLSQGR